MRTFNEAIAQGREIVGPLCTFARHLDKQGTRVAWVEVQLTSPHRGQSAALQLGTWTRKLEEAGWTEDPPGWLWVEVDPDVAYVEPIGTVAALNPLGQLVIDLAREAVITPGGEHIIRMPDDLRARLLDEAKALGWKP